jgi:hypothetical protein
MPGKGDVMDGAMQQAPQPSRQERSDWQAMLKVQAQMSSSKTLGKAPFCLRGPVEPATKRNLRRMRHNAGWCWLDRSRPLLYITDPQVI